MSYEVLASAPGRLDFLNTHQDYKGLPVVSVAINLRTRVKARRLRGVCRARSLNTGESAEFRPGELPAGKSFADYVKAAVASLQRSGVEVGGCELEVDSDVPIASGMASSAALLVAAVGALSALWGGPADPAFVAETAYRAEREVMGIPCGRLDQYGSAFGRISYINTKPPYNVERLELDRGVFVALDSGVRHSTAEVHPQRQRELDEGLRALLAVAPPSIREKLAERHWEVRWEELDEEELKPYLDKIPRVPANRILFTIRMHRSTLVALDILRGRKAEAPYLPPLDGDDWRARGVGAVMTYQHSLLRDLYDVSIPELDRLVEGALAKGAYGAKLSGAGLGGVVMALAPEAAAGSVRGVGEARSWVLKVDDGLRVEYL
ncbi:MAG: galactokinase family protein [Thermoproteus sp.]